MNFSQNQSFENTIRETSKKHRVELNNLKDPKIVQVWNVTPVETRCDRLTGIRYIFNGKSSRRRGKKKKFRHFSSFSDSTSNIFPRNKIYRRIQTIGTVSVSTSPNEQFSLFPRFFLPPPLPLSPHPS